MFLKIGTLRTSQLFKQNIISNSMVAPHGYCCNVFFVGFEQLFFPDITSILILQDSAYQT